MSAWSGSSIPPSRLAQPDTDWGELRSPRLEGPVGADGEVGHAVGVAKAAGDAL